MGTLFSLVDKLVSSLSATVVGIAVSFIGLEIYHVFDAMQSVSSFALRGYRVTRLPMIIYGEPGTGKEQIARYLYLHSSLANHPFIVVICARLNEKTWDFLLNHYNSPLSATGNTIYFQNFESIPPQSACASKAFVIVATSSINKPACAIILAFFLLSMI